MGVMPLQFQPGQNDESLGITGKERFDIAVSGEVKPRQMLTVKATRPDGSTLSFEAIARLDTPVEVNYYRNGGILQTVLRGMAS